MPCRSCGRSGPGNAPGRRRARRRTNRIRAKSQEKINPAFSQAVTSWRLLEQPVCLAMRFATPNPSAAFCACALLLLSACAVPGQDTTGTGPSAIPATAAVASPHNARPLQTGQASWYGRRFHGRTTASGVPFDMNAMTAAHRTLPFGTRVRVTNLANGRAVTVTINDRGPFVPGRIIDLSRGAAAKLDFLDAGITKVKVEVEG